MREDPPLRRSEGALQGAGMLLGAGVFAWRGHPSIALALGALSCLVLTLAAARPAALRAANLALGRGVTAVLLGLVYLLALLPTRALLTVLRVDPLETRGAAPGTHWRTRERAEFTPEDMERTA